MFSDESETWTSYDDYSSYDDDDEELQSQIELIQEQMSQRNRFPKIPRINASGWAGWLNITSGTSGIDLLNHSMSHDGLTSSSKLSLFVNLRRDVQKNSPFNRDEFEWFKFFFTWPKMVIGKSTAVILFGYTFDRLM